LRHPWVARVKRAMTVVKEVGVFHVMSKLSQQHHFSRPI
jgi:hypothetical protein